MSDFPYLSPSKIRMVFEESEFAIRKRWGQNFLIDSNLIRHTTDLIGNHPLSKESVPFLEIGPGLGAITCALAKTGIELNAIEIDPFLYETLSKQCASYTNVRIFNGDAKDILLKKNLSPANELMGIMEKTEVVYGNLPYYITTDLILESIRLPMVRYAVFLVQKEFAQRACAGSAESSLTVFLRNMGEWRADKVFSPGSFYPRPGVDSQIIVYKKHPDGPRVNPELLEKLLRMSYRGKRKKIKNAWLMDHRDEEFARTFLDIAGRLDMNTERRPEELSFEEYYSIIDILSTEAQNL